jgi:hypothetical protein
VPVPVPKKSEDHAIDRSRRRLTIKIHMLSAGRARAGSRGMPDGVAMRREQAILPKVLPAKLIMAETTDASDALRQTIAAKSRNRSHPEHPAASFQTPARQAFPRTASPR